MRDKGSNLTLISSLKMVSSVSWASDLLRWWMFLCEGGSERERKQKFQSANKLLAQSEQRQPSPCVSGFLNGVLTCPAVNKEDQRLYSSSHTGALQDPLLSVCLADWGVLWHAWINFLQQARPVGQLCQRFSSTAETADSNTTGL